MASIRDDIPKYLASAGVNTTGDVSSVLTAFADWQDAETAAQAATDAAINLLQSEGYTVTAPVVA